ncbi:MAG: ribose 5-phosphate isomerase B [Pseudobdellovibrionaceae bacterium]|uniref:ribose 5-phosphate isomerase B n=1 Tax=Oligoflexus sp. TaxID=1971216 RepID=UPI0027C986C3|nr:ribose 5-phosphate isomerase B [Oligoflexus sp.]MDQ3233965.1 ribose 5-phosphate isomerase B [Pseudobdellovibrionaceae bacterium]HYX33607.1 ribose 5-phosphate isomerase B [Oligoflexus sp.]
MSERIGIASDHGGRVLKEKVSQYLRSLGHQVFDYGVPVDDADSVDYPDYAQTLAKEVGQGQLPRGILICGTGIGMSIAANKISGIRAALVWDEFTARMSKLHNNANILCLGERVLNHDRALEFVNIWLNSEFEGSRHQNRLDKIRALER